MSEGYETSNGCGTPCCVEREGTQGEHVNCMDSEGKCPRYRRVQLREDTRFVATDLLAVLGLFALGWGVIYKLAMNGFT